jgi:hypothetical protein
MEIGRESWGGRVEELPAMTTGSTELYYDRLAVNFLAIHLSKSLGRVSHIVELDEPLMFLQWCLSQFFHRT